MRNRAGLLVGLLLVLSLSPILAANQVEMIFPQVANGTGSGVVIRSELLLINNSNRDATGVIEFFDDAGKPLELTTNLGHSAVFNFIVPKGNLLRVQTTPEDLLETGWARVRSDLAMAGSNTFSVFDTSGNVLSQVGVGDCVPVGRMMMPVDTTEGRNSGFAIANPDTQATASLRYELRGMDGHEIADREVTLPPGGHRAEFVREIFSSVDFKDFKGVLSVSSANRFSFLGLRTFGVHSTSLPSLPSSDSAPYRAMLARIGDGRFDSLRIQTSFYLLNQLTTAATARLNFVGESGGELPVPVNGQLSASVTVTVPPGGAAEIRTAGTTAPGVVGWARVSSDQPIVCGAAYKISEETSGEFVSEVGVPASDPVSRPYIYVVEKGDASTGVALTNVTSEKLTLRLNLYPVTASGTPILRAQKYVELRPGEHVGWFVSQLFTGVDEIDERNFEGLLEVVPYITRFGEDIPSRIVAMTLLAHGPKLTSRPAAGYISVARSLSSWDAEVNKLLAQMTLEEKVGQMTQAERGSLDSGAEDIKTYFLGSVLSGGGSGPAENRVNAWADMYDRFQSKALATRLKIPLLYGIDALHGHNNVWGAVVFPHNIGLGATRNLDLVEKVGRITASEVRATGMNWTFSPCVTVPRDERWGRTYEGFGEDPGLVRSLSEAAVRGYQAGDLADPAGISACAKHYVGDGGTTGGIDQGNAQMDEPTLRAIHLPGYLGAMDAGVATIMVSFSSWNGVKMSGNKYLLTDVLKGELGFEGFLVSDWAAIDQLPGDYRAQVKASANAGMDMFMVPYRHREFFANLLSLVQAGEVPMTRIDDAVRRILRVKFAAGLFDRSPLTDKTFQQRFGSLEHREVAREAVRQSVVLLKNQGGSLPLAKTIARIHVSGKSADSLRNQCGGWTIDWQGMTGAVPPGTTVLTAIRSAVSPGTTVSYSSDGSGAAGADVGVVVIGETPYAEGYGDDPDLSLSAEDLAVVNTVNQAGVPVVVVLISGRPMILNPILDKIQAMLAAWLPGTEAPGVADVIFGDYRPTGKLPCSWPRSIDQVPINVGDPVYDPLFPFGFGLTY